MPNWFFHSVGVYNIILQYKLIKKLDAFIEYFYKTIPRAKYQKDSEEINLE